MGHSFLAKLKNGEFFDCVYHANFRFSKVDEAREAKNGNKYVILAIEDNSLKQNDRRASAFIFFSNEKDIEFLKDGYPNRTTYYKLRGKCISEYPEVRVAVNSIVPAGGDSGIVFDRSNLFAFNDFYKDEFLSFEGKRNIRISHTSVESFQQDYDLLDVGTKLSYKRITNSPHDKYQVDIIVPGFDDVFSVPAYLTPTIGKMIDEGYQFEITVSYVPPRDEEVGLNAGIRVDIRGFKK